jgi:sugar lactone lactonase YvrE
LQPPQFVCCPLPAGMLLALDPSTGVTTALMDKLWFANGVAVALDGSFVLVADSIQCRIHRLVQTASVLH